LLSVQDILHVSLLREDLMRLKDKVVIVTGGGSGIGQAACLLIAEEGGIVAIGGRTESAIKATKDMIIERGGKAMHMCLDVSDASAVKAFVGEVLRLYGRIDVLVNNAGGRISATSVLACSESDWDKTFAINSKGVYLMSREVLPSMIENKGGSIINISSAQGLLGRKNRAAYAATKGAIISLTRAMAVDHGRDGIRVNCVVPGAIVTPPLLKDIATAPDPEAVRKGMEKEQLLTRIGEPLDVAQMIVFLASSEASWVTATVMTVDGGITAI
jgi:meso-butanediol dehydrogenase/(S,S)-butanediol dehydrogenase/diacetyl reductase